MRANCIATHLFPVPSALNSLVFSIFVRDCVFQQVLMLIISIALPFNKSAVKNMKEFL